MSIVNKYNQQIPRYTSYPTVPYWDNNLNESLWKDQIKSSFIHNNKDGISLYIHLPYCESLCTYCACNTRITVNHKVETPYIDGLIKEWELYKILFTDKPIIKEIHLGGGTPTFFSPQNLQRLIETVLEDSIISKEHDFSFEGHPANTSKEHLQTLYDLGFRRVSFGIQDFDEKVQQAINRFQSVEEVRNVVELSRSIGYTSINFDLVYGLAFQTKESVSETIKAVLDLKPDRIAFYSYAHVPWIKPGQRRYTEKDLPVGEDKKALYDLGKDSFLRVGYTDIGLDHFALPTDELYKAAQNKKLHRNFMGYTTNTTKLLVGLGCSSISDCWTAYSQNIKEVEAYLSEVNSGKFPLHRGHILTEEDLKIKQQILNIMCKGELENEVVSGKRKSGLTELINDGLLKITKNKLVVTETGKLFLRNIALAIDERYWLAQPKEELFSSAV
jgi:oxygen-independent coproporphyrinogen-3 oxidase